MRSSEPSTESTWCVLIHNGTHMRLESYHDTHEEALTCANEIIVSHANDGSIPFVFVCKIYEQNGDK